MAFTDRLHNRGGISTGYDIENSLKLEKSNNEHLYRAMVDGNRKTWTFSCWIKRTELQQTNSQALIHFGVNNQVTRMFIDDTNDQIYLDVCNTANELYRSITNRRFRDTSAWYHIVWRMDTTQSTAANRMRLYINGVEETSWSQHQIPPQNYETLANTTAGGYDDMGIGTFVWAGSSYDGLFSGYLAQVAHVDGQSYAPTEFGEFDEDSGIWKPKDVSDLNYGTGNNSFFLDFEIASALGANAKGNDVNFSLNNITSANQATDTPTNNFCTWLSNGQLFHPTSAADNPTFNEGGTRQIGNGGTGWVYAYATQAASSGKWYYEGIVGSAKNCMIGACPVSTTARSTNFYLGQESNSTVGFQYSDGNIFFYTGYTTWESGGLATGDIVGFAMDLDNGKAYVSRNGVWFDSANPATNYRGLTVSAMTLEPYMFAMARYNPNENNPFNFGGFTTISISTPESDENGYGNFEYAPPSGFYAMCSKNLAEYG